MPVQGKTSPVSRKKRTAEIDSGVKVQPMPITLGETVTIDYQGLLAQSGANQVFAHIGYGPHENWTGIQDVMMELKGGNTWSCEIEPLGSRLNFCFHDGANNWDNNNGHNWSVTIHDGEIPN